MSADNYVFVGKDESTGKYLVTHRCASIYYADEMGDEVPMEGYGYTGDEEGWTINGDEANANKVFATLEEAEAAATRRPDWIEQPPTPRAICQSLELALLEAHRHVREIGIVEYGVVVQGGLV